MGNQRYHCRWMFFCSPEMIVSDMQQQQPYIALYWSNCILHRHSMLPLILLTTLIQATQTAIISDPQVFSLGSSWGVANRVNKLAQNYEYELTITKGPSANAEKTSVFVNFAQSKDKCEGYRCYLGWINNYTIRGQAKQGYDWFAGEGNPVFMLSAFQNATFSLASVRSSQPPLSDLMDLCFRLLNPLLVQISNLNPFNKNNTALTVYTFFPLSALGKTKNDISFLNVALDLQKLGQSQFANTTSVGWNLTTSGRYSECTDLVAIDNSTGFILERQVRMVPSSSRGQTTILLELKLRKSSVFSDLTSIRHNIEVLSKENEVVFGLNPRTVQLSLLDLRIPTE